jgi:hypothetical protein
MSSCPCDSIASQCALKLWVDDGGGNQMGIAFASIERRSQLFLAVRFDPEQKMCFGQGCAVDTLAPAL